ncbi:uncharacterized protein BO88DRAFT_463241 [Aspergillus vadensis CBS 113365]|uniref:Uncharacterized protein n=1 Tax=Aspergillus vadensis (strain CBS 113365 / IMI 142717 / IBT 24658) TaxID=1448311 RepID=A0A319BDS7_ASPVC|nr:hypothetical protein BO88DRAFT_463241 [Aspergillus vadensis CBS 113365]PYH68910.1 hypothetical protein BO88DRAFT_463241 [Aspergillus vadensis CBS 113365]
MSITTKKNPKPHGAAEISFHLIFLYHPIGEKAKAQKQSHPPENQANTIGNGKSHDAPPNLPSRIMDPEPHDNGYAYLTSGNYVGPLSAVTCSIPGLLADNIQESNHNIFEDAIITPPESIEQSPYDLQTSSLEEQLFKSCPPSGADCGILLDPDFAFLGNPQDQQKGQRPEERHRCRSAIATCHCDSGNSKTPKHVHRIVQYQRAKLLYQTEQLLEKVESLYDVGITLGVLVDNNHLRDLIRRAIEGFRSQRGLETYNRAEEHLGVS